MAAPRKRTDELIGHPNATTRRDRATNLPLPEYIDYPPANPEWCEIARWAYKAGQDAPQSALHAQTDAAHLWITCEMIDSCVSAVGKGHMSAMRVTALRQLMQDGLFTEYARRNVSVELQRAEKQSDPVVEGNVADFRARRAAKHQAE